MCKILHTGEWLDANLSDDEARVLIVRIMGFCDDPWIDPDVTAPGLITPSFSWSTRSQRTATATYGPVSNVIGHPSHGCTTSAPHQKDKRGQ